MSTARRGRGRPRGGDATRTRQAIVDAARRQFAARGYGGASVRSIAGDAGVDPSLIHHHFGDKAQLLIATMELPFNPVERIERVLDGPLEGLAARLIRTFCESWDPHREVFSAAVRSTMGDGPENPPMLDFARTVVIRRVAERLGGEDAHLRATLVAGQVIGLALMRYVTRAEPLAEATVDEVVAAYAPAMQAVVTPHR